MMMKMRSDATVHCISFHPQKPWILVGLANGFAKIWNLKTSQEMRSLNVHKSAVRGAQFHGSEQEFVTAGDDRTIKVWNYDTSLCLLTLYGHRGSINSVELHKVLPWIITSSDDKTIRVWSRESGTCISVLRGHKGAVMSASFHPTDDTIVSASLDETVRVWKFTRLMKDEETVRQPICSQIFTRAPRHVIASQTSVLQGHQGGVTWASFHPDPETDMIVSASDQTVSVWNLVEDLDAWSPGCKTLVWTAKELCSHNSSVSSALFHPKLDIVVSSSKASVMVCYLHRFQLNVEMFSRQEDSFRSLAVHPDRNLVAVGHDNGMVISKFQRERPAFAVSGETVVYVRDKQLWRFNSKTSDLTRLTVILPTEVTSVSLSPGKNALLVCSESTLFYVLYKIGGGSYDLQPDSWYANRTAKSFPKGETHHNGEGDLAVFLSTNHFAVLRKAKEGDRVEVMNLRNVVTREVALPVPTRGISHAGTAKLL